MDENIVETVRLFPVLCDKSCKICKKKNNKIKNIKKNTWQEVAKQAGLKSGICDERNESYIISTGLI